MVPLMAVPEVEAAADVRRCNISRRRRLHCQCSTTSSSDGNSRIPSLLLITFITTDITDYTLTWKLVGVMVIVEIDCWTMCCSCFILYVLRFYHVKVNSKMCGIRQQKTCYFSSILAFSYFLSSFSFSRITSL